MAWVYHNKPPMGWPLDLSEPINEGIVGYWYMPEGSGNIVQDLSGNGNVGTFVGTINWAAGRNGPAIDIAGIADYVDVSVSLGTTFTIIADIFPVEMDAYGGIVTFDNTHGLFYQEASDKITYFLGTDHFSDTVIPHDAWSRIALVRKETAISFYLNGVPDGTDTITNTAFTAEYIGSDNSAEDYKGKMGYVYIFNRALSASEIALLYQFPFYGFLNPDEIPMLDQYYTVTAGGIMTPNTRYWGAL